KSLAMLGACSSGTAYISAHEKAFTTYANSEWKKALAGISPALLRAFLLRIRSLEMSGETSLRATVTRELGDALNMQSALYHFDMEQKASPCLVHAPPVRLISAPMKKRSLPTPTASGR
ncbi:capsid protein, partial [Salmonella enterica subsp. enterica serovar Typhimurium]|nr:capsid protein [Salmonella enterica subsp. enterica serovar Typhimurium]